jgi:hypothetical protein
MQQITKDQAIEQGYKYAGYRKLDEQKMIKLTKLTTDHFEAVDQVTGPLVLFTLESYPFTVSAEKIKEMIVEMIAEQEDVADEDGELADLAEGADFLTLANDINERMAVKKYYDLTDIELIAG